MKVLSISSTKKDFLDEFIEIYIRIATINTFFKPDDAEKENKNEQDNKDVQLHNADMKIAKKAIKEMLQYDSIEGNGENIDNRWFELFFSIIEDKFSKYDELEKKVNDKKNEEVKLLFDYYQQTKNKFNDMFNDKNSLLYKISMAIREKGIVITVDKEPQRLHKYSDFNKIDKGIDETIYRFEQFAIREVSRYQANQASLEIGDDLLDTKPVNISKIRISTEIEPEKVVAIECYCDTELIDHFRNGENLYLPRFLAAVLKAKVEMKEYIGTITMIDEELQTFIITYDDKLESALQEMEMRKNIPADSSMTLESK